MLTSLTINNLVVVSATDIEFSKGLTTITGETGSGKSVIIDALLILMGEKIPSQLIRKGETRSDISGEFNISLLPNVIEWLQNESLDQQHEECLIRRTLVQNGRSRAFINGSAVPIAKLTELTNMLIDVHGQHAHQSLLRPSHQLQLLDKYGNTETLAATIADQFRQIKALKKQLAEQQNASQENSAKQQLLEFQINELQTLDLSSDEWIDLDKKHKKLSNAQQLISGSNDLLYKLDHGEQSIASEVIQCHHQLNKLIQHDENFKTIATTLEEAQIAITETISSLKQTVDKLELDPQALLETEQRLSLLLNTARKYQTRPELLFDLLNELKNQKQLLTNSDEDIKQLSDEITTHQQTFEKDCLKLSKLRKKSAQALAETITSNMSNLAMGGGSLQIGIQSQDPDGSGMDAINFLVSTNPGHPHHKLKDTASGGELSRISLAIQVALADKGSIPTLVFDEVDVGIGGKTAATIGKLLNELAQHQQVICITHLPQVAAWGNQHVSVRKYSDQQSTETQVTLLSMPERINELARMSGGAEITEQTLAAAKELIEQAIGLNDSSSTE